MDLNIIGELLSNTGGRMSLKIMKSTMSTICIRAKPSMSAILFVISYLWYFSGFGRKHRLPTDELTTKSSYPCRGLLSLQAIKYTSPRCIGFPEPPLPEKTESHYF